MKKQVLCLFLLPLATFMSLISGEVPSRSIRERKQSELRKAHRESTETYKLFSAKSEYEYVLSKLNCIIIFLSYTRHNHFVQVQLLFSRRILR